MGNEPAGIVRHADASDAQVVLIGKAAMHRAEAAEEKGSPHRWHQAECYAELTRRGWSQRKIAEEFGTNQTSVCHFIKCVIGYPIKDERPRFWDAYAAVSGEKDAHVRHNAGENEWYTPPEYIEAARAVLGTIGLDPASSKVAQRAVKAQRFFTAEDDGLAQDWRGTVWLNPPYAQELVGRFVAKLIGHVEGGDVAAAILLVNNATETGWFQLAARAGAALCFPDGRVRFLDPDGNPGAPLQGQSVVYFGKATAKFLSRFREFGFCVTVPK